MTNHMTSAEGLFCPSELAVAVSRPAGGGAGEAPRALKLMPHDRWTRPTR